MDRQFRDQSIECKLPRSRTCAQPTDHYSSEPPTGNPSLRFAICRYVVMSMLWFTNCTEPSQSPKWHPPVCLLPKIRLTKLKQSAIPIPHSLCALICKTAAANVSGTAKALSAFNEDAQPAWKPSVRIFGVGIYRLSPIRKTFVVPSVISPMRVFELA